ncbi:MAG: T9SS type A sorting domain-containing protein [Bacteroidota bacterium]
MGAGELFRLNFSAQSSGVLTWDSTTAGLTGLVSTFGQPLPVYYGNGGVQIAQNSVSISSVPSLCANGPAVALQGSPAGGVFSGTGVTGGVFHPSIVGPGTYLVSYTATDASSCTFTSSTFITVLPLPIGNAGPDQTICQGSTTTLTASSGSGLSYLWSTGATTQSISVTPTTASTQYWVRISNASGCSFTDTILVNTFPSAVVSAGSDAVICSGSSTNLSASGAVQYLWSPATGLSSIVASNPVASPLITTSYIVTGISVTGCITRDTVVVTVNPRPTIQLADTVVTYCGSGAGALLEASGAISYVWSPVTGLSDANVSNPVATPATTTVYTVTGTDANGCTNTVTVRVFVPRVNAGSNRIICSGASTTLSTTYTGSGVGLLYQWTPATGLSSAFVANPVASPMQSTLYTVTVTDPSGCAVSSSVTVIVNPSPTVDAGLNVAIAPTQSIQLSGSVSGGASPVSILWSPSSGLSATGILNPVATPTVTTMYYLTATGSNGCSRTDSVLVTVDPNLSGSNISGRLVYRNVARTGISQGAISLDTNSVVQSSINVGSNGAYLFQFLADRTYSLRATVNRSAGGITAADGQLINNYSANPNLLNGIAIQAADVDGNGVVNSADALLVVQRSVNQPNAVFNQFSPNRGNWITEQPLVNIQGANVDRDVEALSLGDVNADFNLAGARLPSGFRIEGGNSPVVVSEFIRTLPVYVDQEVDLGSFQLFFDVPVGMRVSEVILASTAERVIFHQSGTELNVGWFAQNGFLHLNKGDVMLEIKLQSDFSAQEVNVGVRGMSMAYDADAKRHEMVRISIPKFISAIPALQVQCYPNPFSNSTQIIYELPESGKVDVYVTDYTGKAVRSHSSDYAGPGRYSYDLDATGLKDGVYLVQVVYESQLGMFSRQHLKIVLQR